MKSSLHEVKLMSHQSQLCSVSVIFITQNHLQHSKCDINLSESKFAHPCESLSRLRLLLSIYLKNSL